LTMEDGYVDRAAHGAAARRAIISRFPASR